MLKGLIVFIIIYLVLAILNYTYVHVSRRYWLPSFELKMRDFRFRALLFIYGPISVTKKFFKEIKCQDTAD